MSFTRKIFLEGHTYHEIDWTQLQDNIGDYYDLALSGQQGQITSILADYLTSVHTNSSTPHPNLTMDTIAQGVAYIKFSAVEYARFLTGFYDILDLGSTVKFGQGRDITAFYFAKGADADGANVYANDLFSRGLPVYVLVFTSPWILITPGNDSGDMAHGLGYRPSFGILQTCISDPTGAPEDYIVTGDYGATGAYFYKQNFVAWNNVFYLIGSASGTDRYFRVLLFSYMGA